ncbi:MAG: hypothetical protein Q8P20_01495 [bacterium]|nr:hypothetical protein [bacterium]
MNKLKSVLLTEQFWLWFAGTGLVVFAFETLLLGLWAIPIVNYRIPLMAEVMPLDIAFAIVFALAFGFGTSLFLLAKKFNATSCAVGSGSGVLAFFSLLCPICPVFFLAYFGLSTTVLLFSPYFWAFRLVSLLLLLVGVVVLVRQYEPREFPRVSGHLVFQKIAVIVVGLLLVSNQAMAMQMSKKMMGGDATGSGVVLSGVFAQDIASLVTPSSMPFYGAELGLDMSSLNAVNASIKKLAVMAPQQGSNPIQLNEQQLKRYVEIGTEPYITCEFCCGVKTLVREDGSPTCGCAHSIAMRGTAAYLIQNYPEMTNAEISYELVRQKGLYYPGQMQERMASTLAGDLKDAKADVKYLMMNLTDTELADLQAKAKTSGFKPEASTEMVGGC